MTRNTRRIAILLFASAIAVTTTLWLINRPPEVKNPVRGDCQWSRSSEERSADRFADDFYFPPGAFDSPGPRKIRPVKLYSGKLASMDEPVLSSLKPFNVEVYRFIWLRPTDPAVVVRIWKFRNEQCLIFGRSAGQSVYSHGEYTFPKGLSNSLNLRITEAQWNSFMELVKKADFWTMRTVDGEMPISNGAFWVMEGVRHDQYHLVDRQSPVKGEYRDACEYLLKLARIEY